ncbi:MAG: hypothetical protein H0T62_10060 [Parachlamydiaceae bacterium]|nr:hypothetical protein [Parachlamydiaceae bacterium]
MEPASSQILNELTNAVFYERPKQGIFINEQGKPKYASTLKIETLIVELKESGPFVGLGKFGPGAYVGEPSKLKKMFGQDIYYWKSGPDGAKRKEYAKNVSFIILGAQKTADGEHVFFTMSNDVTLNQKVTTREHRASTTDTKIYITSHKTFVDYVNDLYPVLTGSELTKDQLYVQKLVNITPLDSILDRGEGERKCKAIGQEIFDYFKQKYGNSDAGQNAVQRICEAVGHSAQDGHLRKQYIDRAWDGIGDNNWHWMS